MESCGTFVQSDSQLRQNQIQAGKEADKLNASTDPKYMLDLCLKTKAR